MTLFGYPALAFSFVVTALTVVFFLGDRLGGNRVLLQRATQVAIGLTLALLVFSATNAFIRYPAPPAAAPSAASDEIKDQVREQVRQFASDSSERSSESGTATLGAGILLVAAGATLFRGLRLIPAGVVLGGVLVIVLGTSLTGSGAAGLDYYDVLYGSSAASGGTGAGMARDVARFAVLLAGTGVLLALCYWRWERRSAEDVDGVGTSGPPSPPGVSTPAPDAA